MDTAHILVYSTETALFPKIAAALPTDVSAAYFTDFAELMDAVREASASLLIFDVPPSASPTPPDVTDLPALDVELPLLLLARDGDVATSTLSALLPMAPQALVAAPFEQDELQRVLSRLLDAAHHGPQPDGASLEVALAEANRRLNARLQELNAIYTVGKSVTSSLDAREILDRVVLASVNLTRADAGFIILKEGDRLYERVVKRKDDRYTDHRHEESSDSVAWQVIRSGRPAMLHRDTKIATGYLVRALLYVPLEAPETGTMGVLGVVNHDKDAPFSESQLFALSTLADFAAIALENARLFASRETERSRLSGILEQATEAIIVTDPRDRLWLWSDAAARIFGIDAQAQGRRVDECIDNQDIRTLFSQVNGDVGLQHTEVTLEDGRVFNAQLSTIDMVGHVVVMQDITHLKDLDRLKSEFVSTVSHDLRTPLTTIQGYIELLDRAGPLNEMQSDFVGRALKSLAHITALISDLLDIGRIEAGYDLEMRPLRLDELIRTTVDATQTYALDEKLILTAHLPRAPLWVLGNQRRLRQVLDNLISNAIKYNRPSGWIRVSATQDEDHIIVRVTDSGIGIPPQEEARIFDRFYRVQSPETEDVSGTGLGLSIVKSVIEKHKGRIWVDSTLGKGSTFAFVLPILEVTG
ncbi:MAG: GAF domain-containing protein [Anaerolineae bacterium]|nr:GAF domain-containing protein [Anaerolineae bacterium]